MKGFGNLKGEFVKRGEKSEEPSEKRGNDDGEKGVPNEEIDDAGFGWAAFLPSDFRMENVGENGDNRSRNKRREPK